MWTKLGVHFNLSQQASEKVNQQSRNSRIVFSKFLCIIFRSQYSQSGCKYFETIDPVNVTLHSFNHSCFIWPQINICKSVKYFFFLNTRKHKKCQIVTRIQKVYFYFLHIHNWIYATSLIENENLYWDVSFFFYVQIANCLWKWGTFFSLNTITVR